MQRKHFVALFLCSLMTWLVGVSIMPLLPLYAAELGASSATIGNFLAFSFAMLAAGTMLAGRLSRRWGRRRDLIILAGVIALPATWLMGHAETIWQLTLLTSIIWFAAGIALTLQSILMGLFAAQASRGRMFGLLAFTTSLAGLRGISLTIITLLAAFQSGLGLLVNPAAGRLSDKLDRKSVLMLTYGARALGLIVLMLATSPLGFWLMAFCFTIAVAKDAVSPALVTDMAGEGQLDGHMAAFTGGNWAGHVIGFALAGYAMQYLATSTTFLLAASLPLGAILILTQLNDDARKTAVRPAVTTYHE